MQATGATAVSVALVDGDHLVWTESYGYRDLISGRPIAPDEDTLFALGPVSQLVTAIAVLKLVEQGTLNLDAPLVRYLPVFQMRSMESRGITLRMLLSHAAGLPGTDRRNLHTRLPFPEYSKQVLATLADQRLKHPPGFMHVPGLDGSTLLQALLESVTPAGYEAFVQKEILDPLGMDKTRFPVANLPNHTWAAAFRGKERLPMEFTNAQAAAGLYSSPADMAKLITMLVNGGAVKDTHILSEVSLREMASDQTLQGSNPLPSPQHSFGLGWHTVHQPALRAAGFQALAIQGETQHYGTALMVIPAERLGVIVTGASGFTGAAAAAVAERILLRKLVENGCLTEMPKASAPLTPPEVPPTLAEKQLTPLLGIYASRARPFRVLPGTFYNTLRLEGFDLGSRRWQPVAEHLRLRTDGWLVSDEEPGVGYRVVSLGQRRYLGKRWMARFNEVQEILAERVAPPASLDPAWRSLAGRTWVLGNERPTSLAPDSERRLELLTLPGADELLFVNGQGGCYPVDGSKPGRLAGMMLQIPGPAGRDMDDLWRLPVGGQLCLRSGSRIFHPMGPDPGP